MLQRRNTIHPGVSRPSQQTRHYAPTNTNTNPFLGRSSFDNLASLTKQVQNSKSTEYTNPFLFDSTQSKDHYKDIPPTNTEDDPQQQEGGSIRARRMSLHVLKAPFSWNRRRTYSVATTTCTAPLIKSKTSRRPVTVFVPSEQTDHGERSRALESQQEWQATMDSFTFPPVRGSDEILKTSKYCPDENNDPGHGDLPKRAQTYRDRRKSLNPFLNDSDTILDQHVMEALAQPTVSTHQTGHPPRRRHSEFSGLSVEDCSRLLSQHMQARAQQEESELWEVRLYF